MFTMKTKPAANTTLALLAVTLFFGGCNKNETPQPTTPRSPQTNASAANQTNAPVTSATPATGTAAPAIATADGDLPGIRVEVQELKRTGDNTVTLKFALINDSDKTLYYRGVFAEGGDADSDSVSGVNLIDAANKKKYFVVRDTEGACVCSRGLSYTTAKSRATLFAKFPAPPDDVQKLSVAIPHFVPMDDVPISK